MRSPLMAYAGTSSNLWNVLVTDTPAAAAEEWTSDTIEYQHEIKGIVSSLFLFLAHMPVRTCGPALASSHFSETNHYSSDPWHKACFTAAPCSLSTHFRCFLLWSFHFSHCDLTFNICFYHRFLQGSRLSCRSGVSRDAAQQSDSGYRRNEYRKNERPPKGGEVVWTVVGKFFLSWFFQGAGHSLDHGNSVGKKRNANCVPFIFVAWVNLLACFIFHVIVFGHDVGGAAASKRQVNLRIALFFYQLKLLMHLHSYLSG